MYSPGRPDRPPSRRRPSGRDAGRASWRSASPSRRARSRPRRPPRVSVLRDVQLDEVLGCAHVRGEADEDHLEHLRDLANRLLGLPERRVVLLRLDSVATSVAVATFAGWKGAARSAPLTLGALEGNALLSSRSTSEDRGQPVHGDSGPDDPRDDDRIAEPGPPPRPASESGSPAAGPRGGPGCAVRSSSRGSSGP